MFYVYILKCGDGSFYCGYTNDVKKRLEKHKSGKGAKYTRSRLPLELVFVEKYNDKSQALKREYEIKKLSRSQKEKLVADYCSNT